MLDRHLAVFAGGWTLEAAEVGGAMPDVLRALTRLVDQSLVVADTADDGTLRYRLRSHASRCARKK